MATMTLKSIPDSLLNQLRLSAAAARRSLNSEILFRLENSLEGPELGAQARLARARAVRRSIGHPLTDSELRQARDHGRE